MRNRRILGRLTATAALTALVGGLGLVAAGPAQAAGTTLKLDRVRCITQTDVFGDDSPYVLVFATSPNNSGAVRFGKWGPGYLDNVVDSGDTYHPNGTIASGVQAGWTLWTVLMEEDDGNDLSSGDLDYIDSRMWNQWQVSFWQASPLKELNMMMTFLDAIDDATGNDDSVAIRYFPISGSSTGTDVSFNGDGGAYWLRFKLV
jgi:hypothetical protein